MDKYTKEALYELEKACEEFLELRICQIIGNATGLNDPYGVTNPTLIEKLRDFREKFKK